ncbi:pirin family protein [Nakamurella lactea]|uniref:pirin family protein n=1 Tax=Nakamurella lactea TaxID=459515 RepID=UPI00041EFF1F|nr:pirin family protein [Nakamurella lactea]
MSNTQDHPQLLACDPASAATSTVQVLEPREVPLGGPRAMTVRRTLPHRSRSFVGAWCFADHYGPDDVSRSGGMDVPPHPHTGLQTVSWLFSGEIEHRDSAGNHAMVRPGELNLMTGGHGIAHSEVSTPATTVLHGAQLWMVLPAAEADAARDFQHYVPRPVTVAGATVRVFIGELAGGRSPVRTATELLGAEVTIDQGAALRAPVDPTHEHAVLVDTGVVSFDGTPLTPGDLGCRDVGADTVEIINTGDAPARVLVLGGEPFTEPVIMWWNFIGRSTEQIAAFRAEWNDPGPDPASGRFGAVPGYLGGVDRLPAPEMPATPLRPRRPR